MRGEERRGQERRGIADTGGREDDGNVEVCHCSYCHIWLQLLELRVASNVQRTKGFQIVV